MENLEQKTVLITGSAYRLGKVMAIAAARSGADIILHHGHSPVEAEETANEIQKMGRKVWVLKADLNDPDQVMRLINDAFNLAPLFSLINNASIFTPGSFQDTSYSIWQENLNINLTAPFLLSQSFVKLCKPELNGKIINILDWRALRPGRDHFAYTISKAALASMTRAIALAAAPNITVNAIALGAILPPSNQESDDRIIEPVPSRRWAELSELEETMLFLLTGPAYITGEIIHLDGGRHLV